MDTTNSFKNSAGRPVVERLVAVIHENRAYLSEIDGAIGDGDHGINMDKGFTLALDRLGGQQNLSDCLQTLGKTLMMEIGGSMGPLYGTFFREAAKSIREADEIDASAFVQMLSAGYSGIQALGNAKVGDKTLVDTLDPAIAACRAAIDAGKPFAECLTAMVSAAETGWKSTRELVARVGRSARLGERSKGALDAGATSCYLILKAMADEIGGRIGGGKG